MKKHIKLLLLSGIFTLIGIFNFSSAYELGPTYTYSAADYLQNGYIGFKIVESDCSYIQLVNSSYSVYYNYNNPSVGQVFLYKDHSDFNGGVITFRGGESCTIKLTYLLPDSPIIEGGTSTFTPIITGLTNSVNEFIPYVAYVGIGLLTAVIGFVAIKRLINWVRAKIFSSFKR